LGTLKKLSPLVTTIVVSDLSARIYSDLGWPQETLHAIPNGIEFARFNGTGKLDRPEGVLHVGCVARLSADKGIDVLLSAVEKLPEIAVTIVGQGREEAALKKWIEASTLRERRSPPRIRLLPYVNDLGAFYRSLDVLVLPSSQHDPFGLVAVEAMSQGVAVIVSDLCGISHQLHSGVDALIVRGGDVGTLQEALDQMLHDTTMRKTLAEEGRRSALKTFKAEVMVEKYESLLSGAQKNGITAR
jgi:glycosyltransferase involved in cell wall biosynthesis